MGEIGLDYCRTKDEEGRSRQRCYLRKMLPLACKDQWPVVIHCREERTGETRARDDLLPLMSEHLMSSHSVYLHCFRGTVADVRVWQKAFPKTYFGIGKHLPAEEAFLAIPLSQIIIESDAPVVCESPGELIDVLMTLSRTINFPVHGLTHQARWNARRFYRF